MAKSFVVNKYEDHPFINKKVMINVSCWMAMATCAGKQSGNGNNLYCVGMLLNGFVLVLLVMYIKPYHTCAFTTNLIESCKHYVPFIKL